MYRRIRSRSFLAVLTVAALAALATACGDQPLPTGAEPGPSFVGNGGQSQGQTKLFTFEDVDLVDADGTTYEDAVIEAASKDHKNDRLDFTECAYYTEDYEEFLGDYGESGWASHDADEVREFCIENFPNRS